MLPKNLFLSGFDGKRRKPIVYKPGSGHMPLQLDIASKEESHREATQLFPPFLTSIC